MPAIPLAAQEADQPVPDSERPTLTPSNVSPDAALSAAESGGTVTFDASKSADVDGTVVSYEWDLNGDSVYEKQTGAEPRAEQGYEPGTTLIARVRVTDDGGASDDATAAVVVPAAPEPAAAEPAPAEPAPAEPAPSPAAGDSTPLVPTRELEDDPEPKAVKSAREEDSAKDDGDAPVSAAATRSVTISDFEFTPATINISVGDTVSWTNRGPTNHTATANNGSFDSGNLNRGQSFSRRFSSAGTFAYFCEPHPFMTGRVVVSAAGGGSSGSGSGSGGSDGGGSGDSGTGSGSDSGDTAGAGADTGTGSSGSLAQTGVDLIPWSLFGFSLLVFGAALRYRLTAE